MGGSVVRKVSNRQLIERMGAWGWERSGNRGDQVRFRRTTEGGWETVFVQPEQSHKGNPGSVLRDVYRFTGVTEDQFWTEIPERPVAAAIEKAVEQFVADHTQPVPVKVVSVEEAKATYGPQPAPTIVTPVQHSARYRERGIQSRVVEFLSAHPGQVYSSASLASELGCTQLQITGAAGHAVRRGELETAGRGAYRYRARGVNHEHTGTVTHLSEREAAVMADPERMASIQRGVEEAKAGLATPVDWEKLDEVLVDELLELIADRIPVTKLGRVMAWRTDTLNLLRELRDR